MKFEDYLIEKHAEIYQGSNGEMVEHYKDWINNLDTDEFLAYSDLFARSEITKSKEEMLDRIEKGLEVKC